MKTEGMINNVTRLLQYTLTCTIASSFIIGILCTLIFDKSILKFYLLGTSFIYYLCGLFKSPGSLFDINDASVKGICNKCNRIRGNHTKHCSICNKCYYKRDHHCIFIGKCIANNNIKDIFYCLVFLSIYCVYQLLTKSHKLTIGFISCVSITAAVWFGAVATSEKTSTELLEMQKWSIKKEHIKQFTKKFRDTPQDILFPFLKVESCVDY